MENTYTVDWIPRPSTQFLAPGGAQAEGGDTVKDPVCEGAEDFAELHLSGMFGDLCMSLLLILKGLDSLRTSTLPNCVYVLRGLGFGREDNRTGVVQQCPINRSSTTPHNEGRTSHLSSYRCWRRILSDQS